MLCGLSCRETINEATLSSIVSLLRKEVLGESYSKKFPSWLRKIGSYDFVQLFCFEARGVKRLFHWSSGSLTDRMMKITSIKQTRDRWNWNAAYFILSTKFSYSTKQLKNVLGRYKNNRIYMVWFKE